MQLEECVTESNLEALGYKGQQLFELRQKKIGWYDCQITY